MIPVQAIVMILLSPSISPQLTIVGGTGARSVLPFQFIFDIVLLFERCNFDWILSDCRKKVGVQPTFLLCLKVLVELFQKLARVKAAHAFSPSQRRNGLAAFLFAKLFLCACGVKEKADVR